MSEQEKKELTEQVEVLKIEVENSTDMFESMDIANKIHTIEMKLNGVKPTDSYIECIGCGS
tara:strand:+ start:2955 stop:3137 length:183 start_codon:yes stop_codon:yes gene_type:complete